MVSQQSPSTLSPDSGAAAAGDTVAQGQFLCSSLAEQEQALVMRAIDLASRVTADAAELNLHGLATAGVIKPLALDASTLAAAIVLPAMEAGAVNSEKVISSLGPEVGRLLDYTARVVGLKDYHKATASPAQADRLRRMFLAIAQDPRALVLRLADQLVRMRNAKALSEQQQRLLGEETLSLYAPLAGRLGIWQFKWELEDLAFRFLEPDTYKRLAQALDQRRVERDRYIQMTTDQLKEELRAVGIRADVTGRAKHIYSIWNKMQQKHLSFGQLFDVLAVRVLVQDIEECYAVLGLVQTRWPPIAGEFDDYIANPKPNMYRSLHTAVIGPEGRPLEIQIRTHAMHKHAEYGVAAHWRYKEGARAAWAKGFLDTPAPAGADDIIDRFKQQAFNARIYVLTPQGQIVDLPEGATPLDFAYALHTELGHRCRGAKVDGSIVPLVQALQSGQQVEILTTRHGAPSRDWLSRSMGYVHTDSARTKIKRWFKQQDTERHIAQGRDVLERELRRVGNVAVALADISAHFKYPGQDEFLAALGRGDVSNGQLEHHLRERSVTSPAEAPVEPVRRPARTPAGRFEVAGVGNLLTRLAGCCKPIPGDDITGYITQGQDISIHRSSCDNVRRLRATHADRAVDVSWGEVTGFAYACDLLLEAGDRKGLLRDISDSMSSEHVHLIAVHSERNTSRYLVRMQLTVEIQDVNQLQRIIQKLERLPDTRRVRRKS